MARFARRCQQLAGRPASTRTERRTAFEEVITMLRSRATGLQFAVLAGVVLMAGYPARGFADDAADNRAMKEQMRLMMQRIEDLTRQVDSLSRKQAAQVPSSATTPPPPAPVVAKAIPA